MGSVEEVISTGLEYGLLNKIEKTYGKLFFWGVIITTPSPSLAFCFSSFFPSLLPFLFSSSFSDEKAKLERKRILQWVVSDDDYKKAPTMGNIWEI